MAHKMFRKIILFLLLSTFVFGGQLKPPKGMVLSKGNRWSTDGLVGLWLMNEGSGSIIADLSGNGNGGTLVNDTSWQAGKYGYKLNFDGTGDYVDCGGNIGDFGTGDFTIIVEVTATNGNAFDMFVAKGNVAAGDVACYKHIADNQFTFYVDGGLININITDASLVGVPVQFAYVRAGSNAYLYVNGILRGTDSSAGAADISNPHNLTIGGSEGGTTNPLLGNIEYVYILNRALFVSEIAELYRNRFIMFQQEPPMTYKGSVAAAPAGGGQVIMIQMSAIPLVLIFGCVLVFRKAA